MKNKSISTLAIIATVLATLAACISAFMAYKTGEYSKELSQAAISLLDVKVEGRRIDPSKVRLRFLFIFKNVGKEPLRVTERTWAHFDFKSKKFTHAGNTRGLVNTIHPEAVFNHPAILYLEEIDPQLTDSMIEALLPEWIGRHAIIFRIKFKGNLSGINEIKYFLGYKGKSTMYQLSDKEYQEIERFLPDDFKLNVK
ncbi:MAG: hypothetical protein KAX05_11955 [Bacteroidales bacterium]|nr:hypothetical protein [Bacteroidales bacterium]